MSKNGSETSQVDIRFTHKGFPLTSLAHFDGISLDFMPSAICCVCAWPADTFLGLYWEESSISDKIGSFFVFKSIQISQAVTTHSSLPFRQVFKPLGRSTVIDFLSVSDTVFPTVFVAIAKKPNLIILTLNP